MTQTAYVVCKGQYSDRRIIRVYLDGNEADKFVSLQNKRAQGGYSQYDIEEHEVADEWPIEEAVREGRIPGFVAFRPSPFLLMGLRGVSVGPHGWDEGDPVMEVYTERGTFNEKYPCINIPFADAEDDPGKARAIATFAFEKWEETKS